MGVKKSGYEIVDYVIEKVAKKKEIRQGRKVLTTDMKMNWQKTLSWNCWELENLRTVQDFIIMLRLKKLNLVFLMETRKNFGSSEILRKWLGYVGYFEVDSIGGSGGLMMLWEENVQFE